MGFNSGFKGLSSSQGAPARLPACLLAYASVSISGFTLADKKNISLDSSAVCTIKLSFKNW